MNIKGLSDKAICEELGARIKAFRLRKNLTQEEVATLTNLSLNPIKSLERGHAKLSTIVAVLRVLGTLDVLDNFIPEAPVSPMQIAKMHGKKRQRGSGSRITKESPEQPAW